MRGAARFLLPTPNLAILSLDLPLPPDVDVHVTTECEGLNPEFIVDPSPSKPCLFSCDGVRYTLLLMLGCNFGDWGFGGE